ncbi:MAG: hypothetical protein JKX83_01090 [Pseudomonadales bacterium]|nr:hypothetical protein [Pseudomonadales bacterium]
MKIEGIDDQQLIEKANTVQTTFISKQPGFIKRELLKRNDTDYADLIYWRNKKNATAAGNKVENCKVCLDYFSLMQAGIQPAQEFSHYSIIKSWPN